MPYRRVYRKKKISTSRKYAARTKYGARKRTYRSKRTFTREKGSIAHPPRNIVSTLKTSCQLVMAPAATYVHYVYSITPLT